MSVHEWEREREKAGLEKKAARYTGAGSMVPPGRGDEKFHMSLTGWSTTSDKERENRVGEGVRLALPDQIWEKRQQKVKKHPAGNMKMKLRMGDLRGGYRCGYTLISSWCVSISVITAGGGGACLSQIYSRRPEEENKAVFHKHWIFQQDTKKLSLSSRKIMLICS